MDFRVTEWERERERECGTITESVSTSALQPRVNVVAVKWEVLSQHVKIRWFMTQSVRIIISAPEDGEQEWRRDVLAGISHHCRPEDLSERTQRHNQWVFNHLNEDWTVSKRQRSICIYIHTERENPHKTPEFIIISSPSFRLNFYGNTNEEVSQNSSCFYCKTKVNDVKLKKSTKRFILVACKGSNI